MNHNQDKNHDGDHNELDELLKSWHQDVGSRADEARQRVLSAVNDDAVTPHSQTTLRKIFMNRYLPYAAIIALTTLVALFASPELTPKAIAQDGVVMLPDGGRLDAFNEEGEEIGPCSLRNTDVDFSISGHLVRVDIEQVYNNTYDAIIEAVYTFPLSHRGAVDRMTMTIRSGDETRVVEGEIEERGRAREMYETARDAGYVASLLEQERPNIFTQSVANIEPGSEVTIAISYVETLESVDGTYKIAFPTVVGPRYIPGYPKDGINIPEGCVGRQGIVLRGPSEITLKDGVWLNGQEIQLEKLENASNVIEMIKTSHPIKRPDWSKNGEQPELNRAFEVTYPNGSKEPGLLFADNTGQVGGRWFCVDPNPEPGAPFAQDTDQVPDASKITPMPVMPGTRAGHDISISVDIETGGPSIENVIAPLHEIRETSPNKGKGSLGFRSFELASMDEIPNRDFILEWTLGDDGIQESILTHAKSAGTAYLLDGPEEGITIVDGHLALILNPPARVEDVDVPARELVFVLDTSGSMRGFPLEKAKAVMTRAIDSMRPEDTFNLITFAGDTSILWEQPKPATAENRKQANDFINSRRGGGGTEMMKAINAALTQTASEERTLGPMDLVNLPADGRSVRVVLPFEAFAERKFQVSPDVRFGIETTIAIPARPESMDGEQINGSLPIEVDGEWVTREGRRILVVKNAMFIDGNAPKSDPMRIVVFMTDGYVGNDQAILASIRRNAATTRVFSFGIGNSVNRYLLDGMAEAGRGVAEYVTLEGKTAEEAVDRFARRIQTPVLIDLTMEADGIVLQDVLPSGGHLPDLFDEEPIVILARYQVPGKGTITLRGRTGNGPWSRTIDVTLPEDEQDNDVIATLWARKKVDQVLAPHLGSLQTGTVDPVIKNEVVALGKTYSIMTPFTSFVAIEKTRVVSDGKPMLVRVPIELPSGTDWSGFFGDPNADPIDVRLEIAALGINQDALEAMADNLRGDEAADIDTESLELKRESLSLGTPASAAKVQPSTNSWYGAPTATRSGGATRGRSRGGRSAPNALAAMPPPAGSAGGLIGGGSGGTFSSSIAEDSAAERPAPASAVEQEAEVEKRALERDQFARLAITLDRPLLRLAVRSVLPADELKYFKLDAEERYLDADGTITVSIKVDDANQAMLDALEKAGLQLSGINKASGVVAGTVTPDKLVAIGLLDGVLRVVPTSMKSID